MKTAQVIAELVKAGHDDLATKLISGDAERRPLTEDEFREHVNGKVAETVSIGIVSHTVVTIHNAKIKVFPDGFRFNAHGPQSLYLSMPYKTVVAQLTIYEDGAATVSFEIPRQQILYSIRMAKW